MEKVTAAKLEIEVIDGIIEENSHVLYAPEDGSVLYACTVEHINRHNQYHLKGMYNGYTIQNPTFYKFVIEDKSKMREVKFSHWRRLLTDKVKVGDVLEWKITSLPFKEGFYSGVCSKCTGWFEGAKRQPFCKGCCEDTAFATIYKHNPKKNKRPRLIKPEDAKEIAKKAFEMAQLGIKCSCNDAPCLS